MDFLKLQFKKKQTFCTVPQIQSTLGTLRRYLFVLPVKVLEPNKLEFSLKGEKTPKLLGFYSQSVNISLIYFIQQFLTK